MYVNLKFTWSHIFAYIALIFIGYVSYTGLFYDLDDGFINPGIYTSIILIILAIWFIGAQKLKGVDNCFILDFKKSIWIERILLISSPIVFVLCMIPFNYAMNVADKADEIEKTFVESVNASQDMFDKYEQYFDTRLSKYEAVLNEVKDNKVINPDIYGRIGFDGIDDDKEVNIEVATLKRQLNGVENYQKLKSLAGEWIDRVNRKTNVWNVFFIGDLETIKNAINEWSQNLEDFSSKSFTTEVEVKSFNNYSKFIEENITNRLDALRNIYNPEQGISKLNYRTVVWGLLAYLFLLLPWIIQGRHGTNPYNLIGERFKQTSKKDGIVPKTKEQSDEVIPSSEQITKEDIIRMLGNSNNDDDDIVIKSNRNN